MADHAGAVKSRESGSRDRRPRNRASRSLTTAGGLVLLVAVAAGSAAATDLEEALLTGFPGGLRNNGVGLAQAFARTVAASFPVTGTSTAYVYRFDPASDSFQRLSVPLGPVFSERAETVGAHKVSVGLNYTLLQYDRFNGRDLDELVSNDPNGPADHVSTVICIEHFPDTDICSATLEEPVRGIAHLDLEAQIVTLSATYGVARDLDVNVLLPLVRTFLRIATSFEGPDPRAPADPRFQTVWGTAAARDDALGVGDLLLRAKYVALRSDVVAVAAGLSLSLPTGDRGNFHGTGDTLVGTALYASHTYGERVEPHMNLGFLLNADKFDRSQVRYSAGADVRVFDWLTVNTDFLGRSDVAQPDSVDHPVFVQIERADVLQFSTGLKIAPFARTLLGVFNVLLPLNDDGVRSDLVLMFGVEGVF